MKSIIWKSPNVKPVRCRWIFGIRNKEITMDEYTYHSYCDQEPEIDVSNYDGWMYFSEALRNYDKIHEYNAELLEVITVLLETHTPDQVCKGCETPPYCPCGKIERAKEIHKIAEKLIKKSEVRGLNLKSEGKDGHE